MIKKQNKNKIIKQYKFYTISLAKKIIKVIRENLKYNKIFYFLSKMLP